jgi:hypothetical protein
MPPYLVTKTEVRFLLPKLSPALVRVDGFKVQIDEVALQTLLLPCETNEFVGI